MLTQRQCTESYRKPQVKVFSTKPKDLPGIVAGRLLAFSGAEPPYDPLPNLLYPFRAPLARSGVHPRYWPEFESCMREHVNYLREGQIIFSAFLEDSEEVAGMARMMPPKDVLERRRSRRSWKDRIREDVLDPVENRFRNALWKDTIGADTRLMSIFKNELEAGRKRIDLERRYYRIDMLFVHPSFQQHGIGSALLSECLAVSDAASTPIFLESTRAGRPLYASRGFVEVDAVDFFYKGQRIVLPIMLRQPQSQSILEESQNLLLTASILPRHNVEDIDHEKGEEGT